MKISFHGAARTVTGSKHLVELDNGKKILFDCGMFQGMGKDTDSLNRDLGFEASKVDYLILSHAHIDHSGLVPKLVKEGFEGKIFCTHATQSLANILLLDSAEIQRDDTKFINKSRLRQNLPPYEPLYAVDDVIKAMSLFEAVEYNQWFEIENGISVLFTDAGHIIGSAAVHLKCTHKGNTEQISFSGDVGRYRDVILKSPDVFPQADYIIIESTYGDKLHEDVFGSVELLKKNIDHTCVNKKGKLVIPAFSVGRTQELLYYLNELSLANQLPVKVYVDSPLSKEATDLVKSFPNYFNKRVQKLLQTDDDPFDFPQLTFIQSVDESKGLNFITDPCIIISASGMADAGRIKHHIRNNISNPANTILIVGYCEPMSLGGRLMNGAKQVKIFGEEFKVEAEVEVIKSMSAHGDYDDLSQFLSCQVASLVKQVFIVHGEYEVQQEFQRRLLKKGFKDVIVPALHETVNLF